MQILHCITVTGKIIIILVLCSAQTEQRVTRKIDNAANAQKTASIEDEMQGFDLVESLSFLRTSLPIRMYECISAHSILRCLKLFVLQKMESHKQNPRTGNLTRDFLDQFFTNQSDNDGLVLEPYAKMNDQELSKRLVINFQQFFKNSDIKLHFLPGVVVKIVPSNDNKLRFSFKKKLKRGETFAGRAQKTNEEIDENASIEGQVNNVDSVSGDVKAPAINLVKKRKNKKEAYSYKNAIIQMAVPVMVMPAILLGSILPFLLPVLKMATIMSLVMNNSAFIAALIYAARTQANAQEEQHISYGSHPIYH